MLTDVLGKIYQDGEVILKQGAPGGYLYVVQEGRVEVVIEAAGTEVRLAVRGPGEFAGEMEVFDQGPCAATVRALGPARVLTVDKHTLMRQISKDPALAFRLVQQMAGRIREADEEIIRLTKARQSRLESILLKSLRESSSPRSTRSERSSPMGLSILARSVALRSGDLGYRR